MSIDSTYCRAIFARTSWLVLAAATLLPGISALHAQTVTADFGNRAGSTPAIPSGYFGVNGPGASLSDAAGIETVMTAGLTHTRFWITLPQIYATSTPNFKSLDATLNRMRTAGLHPLGVLYGTPPSLASSSCAPPSDMARFGQMAAAVVAHVDQTFPGLMQDYEIWNEPELQATLCVSDPVEQLHSYVAMFAAASAAMHEQASLDGQIIHTGGPVISQLSLAPTWIPALLTNPLTAPYVDFVSFHLYLTGTAEIQNGMNWSQLYATSQSSTHGITHYYNAIEALVRKGLQPHAASTPIYVTEFNDNWAHQLDCCRNDPAYGPLWNSLAITDLLNVVYSGATALPSRITYFNAASKYFCLLGAWDSSMDCDPSALTPYPQFYAFQLFASPAYLDLQSGGNMAVSVSPASTIGGLDATAFYTSRGDDMVVVNSTATAHAAVALSINNPGLTATTGTVYLLNSSNGQISSQPVALTSTATGYSAEIAVPAYSTVALSFAGSPSSGPSGGPAPSGPQAVLKLTPESGIAPLSITADSSASQGGGSPIVGRTTNFGDGTWVSWQPAISHTYTTPGTYRVAVTIKTQSGQLSTATASVTVTASPASKAPHAALMVTPQPGGGPFAIVANSSASIGGQSAIVGRTTDFGDGTWVNWKDAVSHTFSKPGTYTVAVTIKNQAGELSTASQVVTVQ